jgi:hypothetical protein
VTPIRGDIQILATIIESFGEVIDLYNNFQRSFIVPTRCGEVDIDDDLEGIPATRVSFPLRYLGYRFQLGA